MYLFFLLESFVSSVIMIILMKSEVLGMGGSADVHMHTDNYFVPLKAQPELLNLGIIDLLAWWILCCMGSPFWWGSLPVSLSPIHLIIVLSNPELWYPKDLHVCIVKCPLVGKITSGWEPLNYSPVVLDSLASG